METLVFTGGYTEPITQGTGEVVAGECPGIQCFSLDAGTGALRLRSCTPSTPNPSFLTVDRSGDDLYCVNELKTFQGQRGSAASAYRIRRDTGALELLSVQFTGGEDACYAALTPDERCLLVANYAGGSICALPILPDRALGPLTSFIRREGRGPDPLRQASPHPHQILPAPELSRFFVSDLGTDCLVPYGYNPAQRVLWPAQRRPPIRTRPGQGPRHGRFNAAGNRLYVMTELDASVNVYAYDQATGESCLLQTVPAYDGAPSQVPSGSGIRLHPDGKLLFASVRGSDQIAVFRVGKDGLVELAHLYASGGKTPRDFTLSPDGRFLLVGNQDSHNLQVFRVDGADGGLTPVWQAEARSVTAVVCSEK